MSVQVGTECPRCRGSMMPERDFHGEYLTCLQCGHSVAMLNGEVAPLASRDEIGYARPRRSSYRQ